MEEPEVNCDMHRATNAEESVLKDPGCIVDNQVEINNCETSNSHSKEHAAEEEKVHKLSEQNLTGKGRIPKGMAQCELAADSNDNTIDPEPDPLEIDDAPENLQVSPDNISYCSVQSAQEPFEVEFPVNDNSDQSNIEAEPSEIPELKRQSSSTTVHPCGGGGGETELDDQDVPAMTTSDVSGDGQESDDDDDVSHFIDPANFVSVEIANAAGDNHGNLDDQDNHSDDDVGHFVDPSNFVSVEIGEDEEEVCSSAVGLDYESAGPECGTSHVKDGEDDGQVVVKDEPCYEDVADYAEGSYCDQGGYFDDGMYYGEESSYTPGYLKGLMVSALTSPRKCGRPKGLSNAMLSELKKNPEYLEMKKEERKIANRMKVARYRERKLSDPEFMKEKLLLRELKRNPDYIEMKKEQRRETARLKVAAYRERMREDHEWVERHREKERLRKQAERARLKMSPEEYENFKEKDRARAEKCKALVSPEERERIKERQRVSMMMYKAALSPEKIERIKEQNRLRAKRRRDSIPVEERREKDRLRQRERRARMTEEEKEAERAKHRERKSRVRAKQKVEILIEAEED